MISSAQYLIKAVMDSLEREVLPHLEPQATPASNVRACLMLLTHIEARVSDEAKLLFEDNNELRVLLLDAVESAEALEMNQGLRNRIVDALKQSSRHAGFTDVHDSAEENRRYQELLTELIYVIAESGCGSERPAVAEFRRKLHGYLKGLGGRDMQLVEKALARVPV